MAIRPDKNVLNEHSKFNKFDKYKAEQKPDVMKVADISKKDIDVSKARGYSKVDLDTAKILSGNPTLTQDELDQLKKAAKDDKKLETTGQF
jgi:hypothetical protein|tara:strand:- start:109 stop:381 length:273 start_codon:yes stop_codon:yes gene_type:complete